MKTSIMVTAATVLLVCGSAAAQANTVRYATSGDIYGLDPHSMTDSFTVGFLHHVYEPLVRYDQELDIEPALATHWEIMEPTRVRYYLREDVRFHDGSAFNADDVVVSLMRAVHPGSPIKGNLPALKDVEKVDDYTVDLILHGPSPLLNNYLTNIYIFDSDWLEAHNAVEPINAQAGEEGHTTSHANGTGPFIVESRRPDAQTVLVANEDWWDDPQHNLSKIVHTPVGSDATRVAALLSGELDLIVPVPIQDAARIENASGVSVLKSHGLRTIMMGFNMGEALNDGNVEGNPLADVRVRKAIYHSLNMDLIRDRIMRGESRNAGMLIAPEVPGFSEELNQRLPHDPDRAKELLAEAGYPDGFSFNMNCPNDAYVNDEAICQAMAAMMARVGLQPRLNAETRPIHFQKALAGETDMFMLGWATLPMLDGFSVLSAMLHSPEGEYGTWNPGGYENLEVNAITRDVDVELDLEKRNDMMVEAFALAQEDVAWLPLHQQPLSWGARDELRLAQPADDKVRLWYAEINKN